MAVAMAFVFSKFTPSPQKVVAQTASEGLPPCPRIRACTILLLSSAV